MVSYLGRNMPFFVKGEIYCCFTVLYFDQRSMLAHAFAWLKTIKNIQKLWLFSSFFFMRLTWASCAHNEKGTFFIIFECFLSFSTMRTHAQACVRWSKYTTLHTVTIVTTKEIIPEVLLYELYLLTFGPVLFTAAPLTSLRYIFKVAV